MTLMQTVGARTSRVIGMAKPQPSPRQPSLGYMCTCEYALGTYVCAHVHVVCVCVCVCVMDYGIVCVFMGDRVQTCSGSPVNRHVPPCPVGEALITFHVPPIDTRLLPHIHIFCAYAMPSLSKEHIRSANAVSFIGSNLTPHNSL